MKLLLLIFVTGFMSLVNAGEPAPMKTGVPANPNAMFFTGYDIFDINVALDDVATGMSAEVLLGDTGRVAKCRVNDMASRPGYSCMITSASGITVLDLLSEDVVVAEMEVATLKAVGDGVNVPLTAGEFLCTKEGIYENDYKCEHVSDTFLND